MSNIMNHMQAARAISDIKNALREIGCDVDCSDGLDDLAGIIRKECLSGPVINATLEAGPGVRVSPVGKKGYKISANSGATLEADLTDEFSKGTSIQKVLHHILYAAIPAAAKAAAAAPAIVRVDLIKMSYDGVDYYENPAFGPKGQGRRSGLTPNSWYIRLFTHQMKEPFYLDLGPMVTTISADIVAELTRVIDCKVLTAIENHVQAHHDRPHRPHHPGHGHHHPHYPGCKPDEDIDPGFLICPGCGRPQNQCICNEPDEDVDAGFLICPDCGRPQNQCVCDDGCHGHHHHHPGHGHHHPHHPGHGCCPLPTGPCDKPMDTNNNGICDVCGWPTSDHQNPEPPVRPCDNPVDSNLDGICDNCGLPMSLHPEAPEFDPNDLNGDGLCDDCGLPLAGKRQPTQEEIELEKYLSRN